MALAIPFSIFFSTSANCSLPGALAVFASVINSVTVNFSLLANSLSSAICASIDKTCLSFSSVDFRQ
ncbi:hypothetical protein A3D84_03310 [Candidatus Woesebacteria bacterium RIFCSPHIGHO2_02_FULL_42_20]|uniref:Secreted protein n=1 Tax=Candidatus Woesebacteria bacterium RIFCSPHIGHO2_12_FULL_41_24 TaxID=1802510 RepID=A0A1F8AT72_9BACT|nr:MAG: hypothetical protein A2W15_03500 [Candidatus Woesebacteria bacterium RBG_16_41_13]OGM34869.1 MAG: hypothetical protein A3D84_03310 [Candidatus Woesebacteria bacterium RIFCSPHIGHO2_02_FULL_42_20]OGM54498.1 MAG: hypothetical protein A3E44_00345 [Candidatus Woesebacteria bacterium RIFCSPHIGHO2_12_FULL_41_24]OGM65742.1 MAG: hypothetical protein A2969_00745 [Candidatus Woesebacteria bacterium RIFCSPLOWO2_01_FULL_42_67]OGM71806.1 MAG: hypothetical protein A3I55_00670 [Candidatus Woesebacteria